MATRVFGALAVLLLLLAQASEANNRPNPIAILQKAKKFNTLISLLQANNLVKPLEDLLKTSGVTLFAPTDKAFNSLPPGTLKKLTPQQQKTILLLHVLPKYYTLKDLFKVGKPIPTAAPGLSLSFILKGSKPFVSSGPVTTPIGSPIYGKHPLSIFPIDAVLLPRT